MRKPVNTTRMNFSVTFLEKKTKGSFLKPFKKQRGKGTETVPASSRLDGHLIFQSTIPPGRARRNSVKPVFDEASTIHPVGLFAKKNTIRAASLTGRAHPAFKILNYFLPFLSCPRPHPLHSHLYSSRQRKTPLEIVHKPATHIQIKQKGS